jgi:hypothetical protein
VSDFTVVLTLYYSYDSQPPDENASTEDWGFTTSLGYKF